MKSNNLRFWKIIFTVYLIFLLVIIWIYNPDLIEFKNSLLLIPLVIPLFIYIYKKHINDEDGRFAYWDMRFSSLFAIAIVVLFKIIVDYIK